MKSKTLSATVCVLLLIPFAIINAQDVNEPEVQAPKITMETPKGWSGETITLPPGFAKDMTWKGVEVIRFAPGMFKSTSESFFSYGFVFWLPGKQDVSEKAIQKELLVYYRGLAKAVARGQKLAVEPEKFELNVEAVKDSTSKWKATLKWAEPFVTRESQSLYFVIESERSNGDTAAVISVAVSPAGPDAEIWKQLAKVLDSVKFE
jgi:hypothetical protein